MAASWQRCLVYFMRNALSLVHRVAQQMVGATIRTVFAQPDAQSAQEQGRRVSEGASAPGFRSSQSSWKRPERMSFPTHFPPEHWQKIWSNNPPERLNKEVKRRTEVVGIFPNEEAVIRLVGAVLSEQHDRWRVGKRYFSGRLAGEGGSKRGTYYRAAGTGSRLTSLKNGTARR